MGVIGFSSVSAVRSGQCIRARNVKESIIPAQMALSRSLHDQQATFFRAPGPSVRTDTAALNHETAPSFRAGHQTRQIRPVVFTLHDRGYRAAHGWRTSTESPATPAAHRARPDPTARAALPAGPGQIHELGLTRYGRGHRGTPQTARWRCACEADDWSPRCKALGGLSRFTEYSGDGDMAPSRRPTRRASRPPWLPGSLLPNSPRPPAALCPLALRGHSVAETEQRLRTAADSVPPGTSLASWTCGTPRPALVDVCPSSPTD